MAGNDRNVNIIISARNAASAALEKIGLSLGGVAAAAAAAGAAVIAFGAVLSKAIDAASEQEQADVKLALALRSIGENTAETRADLAAFIDQLEDLTKVNDETIASVLSLLTQVGLSGKQLKEVTKLTLDYSAVTGQDAVGAATALGNIIVKGAGKLALINTKFDEGSTAAERLAKVVDQLRKVQGAAEGQAKTFEGATKQISIEWERLLEKLGEAVVKNPEVLKAIDSLAGFIKQLGATIQDNQDEIAGLVTLIAQVGTAAVEAGGKVGGLAANIVLLGKSGVERFAEAFSELRNFIGQLLTVGPVGMQFQAAFAPVTKAIGKLGPTIEDSLGKGTKPADELRHALFELDEMLNKLGIDTLPEVGKQTDLLFQTMEELQRLGEAGLITPEQFDDVAEALFKLSESLPTIKDGFEDLRVGSEAILTVQQEIADVIEQQGTQAALSFSDTLIDGAFGADVAWDKFIKGLLADLAKAIARALILRAILGIATGGVGAAAGTGVAAGGGTIALQHGGRVRGGIPGLDSVAALLRPGEIVLPERLSDDFDAIADLARESRARRSGDPGRPALAPAVQLSNFIVPRRDDAELAELIDEINTAVERRGYRLVSTEVRS